MKKNLLNIVSAIFLIGVMALAFAGCGSDGEDGTSETGEATEPTETTEELPAASVEDPEFDIEAVLGQAGLEEALPADIDYSIEKDNHTCLTVYLTAAKEDELGGVAAEIMAFDADDKSYEEFPDYRFAGSKYGINFVILFATDVQFDPMDEGQTADYEKLVAALEEFEIK